MDYHLCCIELLLSLTHRSTGHCHDSLLADLSLPLALANNNLRRRRRLHLTPLSDQLQPQSRFIAPLPRRFISGSTVATELSTPAPALRQALVRTTAGVKTHLRQGARSKESDSTTIASEILPRVILELSPTSTPLLVQSPSFLSGAWLTPHSVGAGILGQC